MYAVAQSQIGDKVLEHFPKSGNRFLDKKCGKNKELEQMSDSIKSHSALSKNTRLFVNARLWRRVRAMLATAIWARHQVPRFCGTFLLAAFFALVFAFGIVTGGHSEHFLKMVTSSLGLDVAKIDIVGLVRTSEIDVLEAIDLDGDSAMLAFDVAHAREQITKLPWVRSVNLRKIYPNQLHVAIIERQPIALWQHQGQLDIIDEEGVAIMPFQSAIVGDLPLLVGHGADVHGGEMLAIMQQFTDLTPHIRAYRRVADRRWDIVLDNGVEIKLPQMQFEERLRQFLALDRREDLLMRDVLTIDLRLRDRMSVTLSDDAMDRWRKQAERG